MDGLVKRIDLGFVNAYLLKAEGGFVLVDTGLEGQGNKLEDALEDSGCGPGCLKLIVITHADRDHMGNAAGLAAKWKAPVAVHGADREALEGGAAPARRGRTFLLDLAVRGMAKRGRKEGDAPSGGVPKAEVILFDGQSLAAWGLDAKVIHLPGHTPGSIALLLKDGSLIAGDFFSNRKKPGLSPFVWSFEEYGASLGRIKGMAGQIKMVYPGHGKEFEGREIEGLV